LKELDQYLSITQRLREMIAKEDADGLEKVFQKASLARQQWDES
jgi:prephenate dehydrogenase